MENVSEKKHILHITIRDYSKDDGAPHHLEHLDGFNPIPKNIFFFIKNSLFVSLSLQASQKY